MIEFLDKKHRRENFDGGKALLNNYLKTQAGQDINQKLSTCFVLADPQTNDIQGYYTLSNNSIPISSFPEHIQKKLPKSYTSMFMAHRFKTKERVNQYRTYESVTQRTY